MLKPLHSLGLVALLAAAPVAAATVTDFEIDLSASSVAITDQSSPNGLSSLLCDLTRCGVDATLADDLSRPLSFSLAPGESKSFDFITLTSTGIGAPRDLSLSATLGFADPALTTSADADGALAFGLGSFLGGVLAFDGAPARIGLADGSVIEIAFGGLRGFFFGPEATITATVSSLDAPVVSTPGSLVLFLSGLSLLGFMSRRRRRRLSFAA